ncbi:MAG: ABC transporter substrate-binding protein [Candidatus Eisenbacteria bacterium]
MTSRMLALAVTVAVMLAAAASAGAQTTTPPTTTPPTTTPPTTAATSGAGARTATQGISAKVIKVGGIVDSFVYSGADIGAKARFQRANDAGGVNGRTINYTGVTDDKGDATLDTKAATTLALVDKVFAVVPAVTPNLSGSQVLVQQKVPYFGWGLSSNFCGNEFGFGFTGCLVPARTASNAWGMLISKLFGASSTGKTAAILTENSPAGEYQLKALKAGLKSAALRVVYAKSSLPVFAAADYPAILGDVMTSTAGTPPDSIFVVGSISSVDGVQQAVRDAGRLVVFTNQLEYAPNLVAPAVGSFVMIGTAAVETASTNPAMQQLITDVHKIAPDQPIDQSVIAGYFSADLFLAAVRKAGKNLTVDRLIRAANQNFTYSVPKTVGPTKFPAAHSQPTPCGSLVSSNGTAYSVKVPYSCGKVVAVK